MKAEAEAGLGPPAGTPSAAGNEVATSRQTRIFNSFQVPKVTNSHQVVTSVPTPVSLFNV